MTEDLQRETEERNSFATDLAIYETAVIATSLAAPNWAAFSRWMSAGAGAVIGGVLSSFVQFKLLDSPVSLLGASLAALSLVPALRIEWLYLLLQPIGAASKAGEDLFPKVSAKTGGDIDLQQYGRYFLDRVPPSLRAKVAPFLSRPVDLFGAAEFFTRLSIEGRRFVMWQMYLLTAGVLLLAAANVTFGNWPYW